MVKKRWLALLLALLMGMSILTGCSPAEKSYYSLMREVSTQKVFEDSGSYIINLTTLPASMFSGPEAMSAQTLSTALGQLRIEYRGQVDMNQEVFRYDYTILDNRSQARKGDFSVAYKGGVMYIKVDGIMNFIKEFGNPVERQNLDRIFAGVEWISMSDQELTGALAVGSQPGLTGSMFRQSSGQQLIFQKLLDGLVNDVYSDYSTSLVSQNGNKYVMTLQGRDLMDVFKSGAVYTINNIDKVSLSLQNFLTGLTPAEAAQLGLTPDARMQAMQGLQQMVTEVKRDGQSAIREIESMSAASEAEMLRVINDSAIVSSIEKTGTNTYQVTSRIHLNISDPAKPGDRLAGSFSTEQNIRTGTTVQVAIPVGAVSMSQLQAKMPRNMTVNIDSGAYTSSNGLLSNNGRLSVQMVEGRTYLPLRMVGESLGETVGWDQAAHQAYVVQNGQRINMAGVIVNSRTYIKMRDFEKLGFAVGWNDYTRTVTVQK